MRRRRGGGWLWVDVATRERRVRRGAEMRKASVVECGWFPVCESVAVVVVREGQVPVTVRVSLP